MRLAVLIGVSDYSGQGDLPSGENDVRAMERLLRATDQYEQQLLVLSGDLPAEPTKRRIIDFLKPHRRQEPEEVFFYYSGHGHVLEDRLIYPMTDWAQARARSTAIHNDELDQWLKELNPKLTVKVVDCCYAGQRYVKSIPEMKELVQPSEGTFYDLFFFLSSRFDQPSLAGERDSLSLYTERFLKALASHPDGTVRYQQLVDRIHEFFGPNEQEPQFNIQGGVGHIFCDLNQQVRAALKCVEPGEAAEPEAAEPKTDEAPGDLKARVDRDAQACIPTEEAEQVLLLLRSQVEGLSMESLDRFYQVETRFPDWTESDRLAGQVEIGKWFKRRPNFFGRAIEQEPRPRTILSSDWLTPRRPFVTGFATHARVPYDRLQITAAPKYPNLRQWEFAALAVWSVREAVLFIYSMPVAPSSWGEFETPEEAPWKQVALSRSSLNSLPSLVKREIEVFTQRALEDVERIVGQ